MKITQIRLLISCFLMMNLMFKNQLKGQLVVNPSIDNQTFVICSGLIIDSGGQGGPGYSNGENIAFTICSSNPGNQVTVTFQTFALSNLDTNPNPNQNNADRMYVFDGPNTSANSLGNYGGNELQGVVIQATPQNTSGCLTFQFVSNDIGTGSYAASISCIIPNAGCTDSLACNYNASASEDNGSCQYPSQSYLTCEGNCLNDQDLDGVCDEIQYSGIHSVPQAISYQAALRNAQGFPLNNQAIQVRLMITQDSISGIPEYVEMHEVETNNLGLFSVFIGQGMSITGDFGEIDWVEGNKFLSVEFNTGVDFQLIGTQQLISVPYAQHSRSSSTIKNHSLPVFEDNSQAISGGLAAGDLYRTSNGDLKIVF